MASSTVKSLEAGYDRPAALRSSAYALAAPAMGEADVSTLQTEEVTDAAWLPVAALASRKLGRRVLSELC